MHIYLNCMWWIDSIRYPFSIYDIALGEFLISYYLFSHLGILSLKNLYTILHYENSLAVIHSPIETIKVSKRIADLIIAGRLASDRVIQLRTRKTL